MTLLGLFQAVELVLGYTGSPGWSSYSLGRELARVTGISLVEKYDVECEGLPGVVVVVVDELQLQGRAEQWPELVALATVLLSTPVLNMHGHEVWVDSVRLARESAALYRGEPCRDP